MHSILKVLHVLFSELIMIVSWGWHRNAPSFCWWLCQVLFWIFIKHLTNCDSEMAESLTQLEMDCRPHLALIGFISPLESASILGFKKTSLLIYMQFTTKTWFRLENRGWWQFRFGLLTYQHHRICKVLFRMQITWTGKTFSLLIMFLHPAKGRLSEACVFAAEGETHSQKYLFYDMAY